MGVTASLSDTRLQVVPGQEAACAVHLHNTGAVVDQFTVDLVGDTFTWAVIEPPVLNLFPGDSGEVVVRFRPPRSAEVPAGTVAFGVRVMSREDPRGSVVEEGTVEVAPFTDLKADLVPRISHGRRRGRHRVAVDNLGNQAAATEIVVTDPDDQLKFRLDRPTFTADPGTATMVRLTATPRRRFLRGPNQTRKFQVLVLSDSGEPVGAEGAMVQRPLLPTWLLPLLAVLAVLVLVAAILWATLLKPALKSAAKEAVAEQTAPIAAAAEQAKQQAAQAGKKADDASTAADDAATTADTALKRSGGTGGSGGSGGSGGTAGSSLLTVPIDFRIQADAAPRADGFDTFTFSGQPEKPLDVTDIQLQNPSGDAGLIEIRRADGAVWLRFGLENFRDYDAHFVQPVRFSRTDKVVFAVQCEKPGTTNGKANKTCTPAVTFSGRTTKS
jgi:hypothetical protein